MPTDSKTTPLDLALDLFLTAKQAAGVSPRTLAVYRLALARFAAWLQSEGVTEPKAITAHLVRRYIVHLQAQPYKAATVHVQVRPVKTWLRFLYRDDLLPVDVFAKVQMPKLDKPILPAFSAEHVKALLSACEHSAEPERDRAIVLTLLDTGVRAAELCNLTLDDLDRATGALQVRRGKGGKGRVVYLGARAKRALLRYLLNRTHEPATAPLFPSQTTGQRLTPNSLLLLCRRLGQRADVPNCHPHTFRRTFALESLRAGMDLARLAGLMGHADLQIVRQYLALVEHDLADAHRQHGPVDALLGRKDK
jgi:integrase/recombinase XerD